MLTLGTIVGIVFIGVFILAAIGFGLAAINDAYDGIVWGVFAVGCLLMVFVTQIGFMLVGYSSEYLAYKPVSGVVEKVEKRLIADGDGMAERFVFVIDSQQYGVDDTRASLIEPGDSVNLNCTKQYVWGSTNHGYACNWG